MGRRQARKKKIRSRPSTLTAPASQVAQYPLAVILCSIPYSFVSLFFRDALPFPFVWSWIGYWGQTRGIDDMEKALPHEGNGCERWPPKE